MDLEARILAVLRAVGAPEGTEATTLLKLVLLVGFGRQWDDLELLRSELGPTSVTIWDAIDRLEEEDLISCTGGENVDWRRRCRIAPKGQARLEQSTLLAPVEGRAITRLIQMIDQHLWETDARVLATAVSVVYPPSALRSVPDEEAIEWASRRQGWLISEHLLDNAAALVRSVRVAASE